MAKRITVSVPDSLAEKIEKWKHAISPSAIFQLAVSKKIEQKEEFLHRFKESPSMADVIARLKEEKAELENSKHQEGALIGVAWAKAASYQDLYYAAEVFKLGEDRIREAVLFADEMLGDYFKEAFASSPVLCAGLSEEGYISSAGEYWLLGWQEAVFVFWLQVSKQL